eukprot:PhF_6_TR12620/c1_g3_i3/m.19945
MSQEPSAVLLQTHRVEIIRLMAQTLQSLGLKRTADTLQEETGISLQTEAVSAFRESILNGAWKESQDLIQQIGITDPKQEANVKYLILRQQYLELLEARQPADAIKILRSEIQALVPSSDELHRLASLIMCKDPSDLHAKANWDGKGGHSRPHLLRKLHTHISGRVLMQEDRLATLLLQAQEAQLGQCVFHNVPTSSCSLLVDHTCTVDDLPKVCCATLTDHSDEVWYVAFSQDGKMLASCGKDTKAYVYNIDPTELLQNKTPAPIATLVGHSGSILQCQFDYSSTRLITCSEDNTVNLWNVGTQKLERTFVGHTDPVNSIAWLPCGNSFISASEDKFIMRWDVHTGAVQQRWYGSRVYDLAVSSDGTKLVTVDSERRLCVHSLLHHGDFVQTVHSSLFGNSSGGGGPSSVSVPRSRALSPFREGEAGIGLTDIIADVREAMNSLDDTHHGVGSTSPQALVETSHEPSVVRETESLTSLCLAPDGVHCLVNVSLREQGKGLIVLYDISTGKPVQKYFGQRQTKYVIRSCFGGPRTNFVACGSEDHRIVIFQRSTGRRLQVLKGHAKIVSSVAWNPVHFGLLASASDDHSVKIWCSESAPSSF